MKRRSARILGLVVLGCALLLFDCKPPNGFGGLGFSELFVSIDGVEIENMDAFTLAETVDTYFTDDSTVVTVENRGEEPLVIKAVYIDRERTEEPEELTKQDIYLFELSGDMIDQLEKAVPVSLDGGESGEFTVEFTPLDERDRYACITIECDDPNYSTNDPYHFSFFGTGVHVNPEMDVGWRCTSNVFRKAWNGTELDLTDEAVDIGGWRRIYFYVANSGEGAFNLVGQPKVELLSEDHYLMFEVENQPGKDEILPGGPSVFWSVMYRPTSRGKKRATLKIETDDPENQDYRCTLLCSCSGEEEPVSGELTLTPPDPLPLDRVDCTVAIDTQISDQPAYEITFPVELKEGTSQVQYALLGPEAEGDYYIWACIDVNGNEILGDPGDFLGIYGDIDPNAEGANAHLATSGRSGYNFGLVECTGLTYDDALNDVTQSYLDIDEAILCINWYRIYGSLTLRGIPGFLLFDREGGVDDVLEYLWEVVIDVNNNSSIDEGDFALAMLNGRLSGETQQNIGREELVWPTNTQQTVMKIGDTPTTLAKVCGMTADLEGEDTFVFTVLRSDDAELSAMPTDFGVKAYTFYLNTVTLDQYWDQ